MNAEDRSVSRRAFLRGAAGAAAVAGASGTAAAAESEGGSSGPIEVSVVNYAYNPGTEETLYVKPGQEVKWVWETDGHNIVVESKPDDSDWEGHEPLEDTGFEYSHTFETTGTYEYFCEPHKSLGMVATIEVTENPPEQGGYETILPDSAKTLGVAGTGAMVGVLGLGYFFMKYGGDYGEDE